MTYLLGGIYALAFAAIVIVIWRRASEADADDAELERRRNHRR